MPIDTQGGVVGMYLDPIYFGRYPESMIKKLEHRLPKFTDDEIALLQNSIDFVGLNHYTTRYITPSMSSEENTFYYDQEMDRIGILALELLLCLHRVFVFHLSILLLIDLLLQLNGKVLPSVIGSPPLSLTLSLSCLFHL
ncbi:Beta-glucosidase 4 [Nymphaea thermarum]|nr:Beta-glucosidase 4 [Nymphaea thermarum]